MQEYFKITSLHRDDIETLGLDIDASKIKDEDMEAIARKMADAYIESSYWIDLEIITKDILNIK